MNRFLFVAAIILLSVRAGSAEPTRLTPDEAVRTALQHNAALLATLQDVGISHADVEQATLLRNPQLGASLRFPQQAGFQNSSDFSLTVDVLDALLRPVRQQRATLQVGQTEARVREAVADLASRVRQAWYQTSAAQEAEVLQQTVVTASEGADSLAQHQFEAGTLSQLDRDRQQAATAEDRLDLLRSRQETQAAKLRLLLLMGGVADQTLTVDAMPSAALRLPEEAALEQRGVASRGILAAARLDPDVARQTLQLARKDAGWGEIRAGLGGGQEVEGVTLLGPVLQLSVPVFNHNQGDIHRLELEVAQGENQVKAVESQVRYEIHTAWLQVRAAQERVDLYDRDLLPARSRIVAEGQLHYNNMLLSIYQLLADRQAQAQAQHQRLDAWRDYWCAVAELARATGLDPKNLEEP